MTAGSPCVVSHADLQQYENIVWEGRFQPFHLGHLAYVDRMVSLGKHIWIWVLANEMSEEVVSKRSELSVPDFTSVVDPHHRPEKNLLPFWLRYRIVCETLLDEFGVGAPVTVCGGRRLDLAWDLYKKILPPRRVFLTPNRDDFEDAKAAAWQLLGETCFRVDVSDLPAVSGTMIRDRILEGAPLEELLPRRCFTLLREEGYLDSLKRL